MIQILVDEGYAYDYLAILSVKNKKLNNQNTLLTRNACNEIIMNQVGDDKHLEILYSQEFNDLLYANENVFDAVDKAKNNMISAKEVDDLNMKRYYCKIALQDKFFPDRGISEIKV